MIVRDYLTLILLNNLWKQILGESGLEGFSVCRFKIRSAKLDYRAFELRFHALQFEQFLNEIAAESLVSLDHQKGHLGLQN